MAVLKDRQIGALRNFGGIRQSTTWGYAAFDKQFTRYLTPPSVLSLHDHARSEVAVSGELRRGRAPWVADWRNRIGGADCGVAADGRSARGDWRAYRGSRA